MRWSGGAFSALLIQSATEDCRTGSVSIFFSRRMLPAALTMQMQPHQFVAKQNNKVVIALRQVRVDWHFFLFWPSRNLRAEGFCDDASFGRLLSPHSPEKSCRSSPGCRRRPLRHDSGGCQMRQTTKAEVRLE